MNAERKKLNESGARLSNLSSEEDFRLVRSAQRGDTEAFGQLVRKYQQKIYGLTFGITGNQSVADDLAQETFLKAHRALNQFGFRSSFYTWLYRIALNTTLNKRKKMNSIPELELNPQLLEVENSPYLPPGLKGRGGDQILHFKELHEDIQKALDSLPPQHRAVVVMHEIEGMSHGEIARILKCSEGTVRSRLHYARRRLQEKLKSWLE